jgi:hypothetical protein
MSATSQLVYSAIASAGTTRSAHRVQNYSGKHPLLDSAETTAYIAANKHVACADCHDTHAAQASIHTSGSANGHNVSGALTSVWGVSMTVPASAWTTPTYSVTTSSTDEWMICFKCHSNANASFASWGGTGVQSWTNVGLEFNPRNASFHPVVAALNSVGSGSSVLTAAEMRAGWNTLGRTMYCSDCHAQSNTGSFGPHGSSVKWMLKGPNQAWPYMTAAANGTSATVNFRLLSNQTTGIGTADGLFCLNCHATPTGNYHGSTTQHTPIACVMCHIRVPHGGKVGRLSCATGSTTAYPGNLPLRYTANGAGLPQPSVGWLVKITKGTSYTTSSCGWQGGSCSSHANTNGTQNW